jgi:hypothetical protein
MCADVPAIGLVSGRLKLASGLLFAAAAATVGALVSVAARAEYPAGRYVVSAHFSGIAVPVLLVSGGGMAALGAMLLRPARRGRLKRLSGGAFVLGVLAALQAVDCIGGWKAGATTIVGREFAAPWGLSVPAAQMHATALIASGAVRLSFTVAAYLPIAAGALCGIATIIVWTSPPSEGAVAVIRGKGVDFVFETRDQR